MHPEQSREVQTTLKSHKGETEVAQEVISPKPQLCSTELGLVHQSQAHPGLCPQVLSCVSR